MKSNEEMIPCPHCGEAIKKNARACPHCGSDENTGWSEHTYLDGVDLGDDFDYDSFHDEEFGDNKKVHPKMNVQFIVGAVLLLAFLIVLLSRIF